MKKLSAVALAMLAVTSAANAADVYKNERMSLDMYGRIYAGQFMGTKKDGTSDYSDKIGANQFIRFGVKADSAITGTMKAVAQYEIQSYIGNSEKINNVTCDTLSLTGDKQSATPVCKDDKFRTRLAFAGVKSDDWGQVTFGRQKGAISLVSSWTDVALADGYGYHGMGIGADTFGTDRSSDLLKYSAKFGDLKSGKGNNGLALDLSYKFDGNTAEQATSSSADAAYGVGVSYTLIDSLSFGTGYTVGLRDKTGENDAKIWVIGVKFDNKSWYAALNYADGSDWLATGKDHKGIEAAVGYNFASGFGLMAMYNKQDVDTSTKSYDGFNYYTLGTQYQFNKALRVIAEYRIQNLDAQDYSAAGGSAPYAAKDDYQLAVRYDF